VAYLLVGKYVLRVSWAQGVDGLIEDGVGAVCAAWYLEEVALCDVPAARTGGQRGQDLGWHLGWAPGALWVFPQYGLGVCGLHGHSAHPGAKQVPSLTLVC